VSKNIVITGAGIVSAIGCSKEEVTRSLLGRRTGIGEMHFLESAHHELPVGEVKMSSADMKRRLGIDAAREVSRTVLMGMMAVGQAVREARVDRKDGRRILLVSGTTVGGMDVTERYYGSFATSDEHLGCMKTHDCGSSTRLIAEHFRLFDDSTTLSTACSSSANALMLGARLIETGQADIVVAGGTEALTRFHLNGFNALMILDRERCRPFDATRAGLNLGEGAAYVVLESEAAARARGAAIQAWLSGSGNACDAFHQTASSDNGEGACLAMKQALDEAGLSPRDIDYVNAHGTGTPNNDLSEGVALQRVFGAAMPPVSSTKSFTGHATSASGSIETVICLLAMQQGFIPANLGWQHPIEGGIIPTLGREECRLRHVMCNSFGFGGNDTSLILSAEAPDAHTAASEERQPVVAARVEITDEAALAEIKNYVKPMEARRLGRLLKSALLSSLKALEEAGVETPDAIITATALGCLENSVQLLNQLRDEGEQGLKPTWFMQSTHNTVGSAVAIHTGCHGYNATYTHGEDSLKWALADAEMLIRSGRARSVLVGLHDETTPEYRDIMSRLGKRDLQPLHSIAMVLTCGE
jgi:3-oxoacyl-(acyl-carrier-protein) synthase